MKKLNSRSIVPSIIGLVAVLALIVVSVTFTGRPPQEPVESETLIKVTPIVTIEPKYEIKPIPTFTLIPSPTHIPTPTSDPTPTHTPTIKPTEEPDPFYGQSTFKSYESYRAITNQSSPQYQLQQIAYTGDYGIRMVEDRYCVAMGSYWATEIGTKLDVYLESGELIKVILGDNKQDKHTSSNHRIGSGNRDVLEFIVDPDLIPEEVRNCGSFNCIFSGRVSAVVVVEDE